MSLDRFRPFLAAALFVTAGAHAATTLVSEGFENVRTLADHGWVLTNLAPDPTLNIGWFQGDTVTFFPAHSGDSFIASNFSAALPGTTLDNWLITPEFSTAASGTVTFWLRGAADEGFTDTVRFGFSDGSDATADFTVGTLVTATGDWTQYSATFAGADAGSTARFAIEYTGAADLADYIGIDDVSITAVPEPASLLMFWAGLLGLAAARRHAGR